MFSFFRKKKFDFKCPICKFSYILKLDPSIITEYDYKYRKNGCVVAHNNCQFCKTEITVVFFKSNIVEAFDDKWEEITRGYDLKLDSLGAQIGELEDILEDNPDDLKAKNKLEKFQKQYDKIEKSYDAKCEKYDDRKTMWYEKREDKFGG